MPVMRIQELRKAAGLTQIELANHVGVMQSVISDWERESYLPKARDLPRLANVLGCTIQDLFVPEDDADREGGEKRCLY